MMKNLTNKQEMFCREYLIDLNATQAAVRAGYSTRSAGNQGSALLANPQVQGLIATLMEERTQRVEADADYVLKRLVEIDQLDVADILDAEGDLLSIALWPAVWRMSVSAVEIAQTRSAGEVSAYLKKVKLPDKVRNLELLGKHANVVAFRERQEQSAAVGRELVINVSSPQVKTELEKLQEKLSGK